jgi:hypothetical protein
VQIFAVLRLQHDRADATNVTWVTARYVIVAVVAVSALAVLGIAWPTYHAPVTRQWAWLYPSEKWDVVKANSARRGLAPDSVHVVTATTLTNGRQFAIIGGRTATGRSCVAVARGTAVGAAICRISKPVMVFYAPDICTTCSPAGTPMRTLSVLGLIRRGVTVTVIAQGHEGGVGAVPADMGFAFNSNFVGGGERLRARDAGGRVLASFVLHP